MDWTRPLGFLCALGVGLTVIGALLALATGPLVGSRATAAIVTVALVVASVVTAVAVGTRLSPEWLNNSGYWLGRQFP
ncbi:hypothetical protein BRC89_03975 [Halobacteriales archaeon QS_4_70_19]|jgi:hypothetical protein|nr:MAG: hypothetical protein BRC89_03975 [Halobacteriales archaeon QS_4_70_19]